MIVTVSSLLWLHAGFAASRQTFLTTYLRAGPGQQYAALDEVPPHSQVDVRACEKGWCRIAIGSVTGFIDEEALSAPDIHAKPTTEGAACVNAFLNGRPRGADEARLCRQR